MTLREFLFAVAAAIAIAYTAGAAHKAGLAQAADIIASDCRNANEAVIRGIAYACKPIYSDRSATR